MSIDQMHGGFCRFYANVDDIVLDIPHVYNQLEKMVQRVAQRNLISSKVRLMCPNRYVRFKLPDIDNSVSL